MKLSLTTKRAVAMLGAMATEPERRWRLRDIVKSIEGDNLKAKHYEEAASALVKAGAVESKPGPAGGYRLARRPEEMRLLEVLEHTEGPQMLRPSVSHAYVSRLRVRLRRVILDLLRNLRVSDLER